MYGAFLALTWVSLSPSYRLGMLGSMQVDQGRETLKLELSRQFGVEAGRLPAFDNLHLHAVGGRLDSGIEFLIGVRWC